MKDPRPLCLTVLVAFAFGVSTQAAADVRTYRNPTHQGYRLDYCEPSGGVCGEPIATEWCRAQGYVYASDWSLAADIGALFPTLTLTEERVCREAHCDGFSAITCAREGGSFRLPSIGASSRATVITPDRRGTAPTVGTVEYRVLVPDCHQREPGRLLCEGVHDYQHCRTLLSAGKVAGCRAGLAFEGAFAEPRAAAPEHYDLDVRSVASASVRRGRRGDGRLRGNVRYAVRFDVPAAPAGEACLQRDRYVYYPTGPRGGMSTIDDTQPCDAPIRGRFEPHQDDLLSAYDLCQERGAWGSRLQTPIELLVAGLFHFTTSAVSDRPAAQASGRIVAPYVTVQAPMRVDCRD